MTDLRISKITPKLQVLDCCRIGNNASVIKLLNILIKMHSKQFIELYLFEDLRHINAYSCVNLKTLSIDCPNNDPLKQIIDSVKDLKVLTLKHCECDESTMRIISKSFEKFKNMDVVSLECDIEDIPDMISYIERGLLISKNINRKSLKVSIDMLNGINTKNIKMRDIELYISRIMNALDTSKTKDTMFIFMMPFFQRIWKSW